MNFIIYDDQNTRWAYGSVEDGIPPLQDICNYLLSSLKPEIFSIALFTDERIVDIMPLMDYAKNGPWLHNQKVRVNGHRAGASQGLTSGSPACD